MTLNIHTSAADNFNKKSLALVQSVKVIPVSEPSQRSFPSELHVVATLTDKDIIGDIDVAASNYRGETTDRYFYSDDRQYGLGEADYKQLIDVSETIQALPTIRSALSRIFIEKHLFKWIELQFKKEECEENFIDYLKNKAQSKIKKITIWTPVANFEVETSFPISKSEIRPLSKSVIADWESKIASKVKNNNEGASALFKKMKKDFQGLAAVVTIVEAEPEHAKNYAIEEAQRITAILGIFSAGMVLPDMKCVSKIKGSENIEQSTTILDYGNDNFQMNSGIIDAYTTQYWRLSQKEIIEIKNISLDKISSLLESDVLQGFKETVLSSLLLYSKAAFTSNPIEKVVYMLSSLESVLLKNETEPIQQNLAERLAVFTVQELTERKAIIKLIKTVYGLRSKYLHHGHLSSELEIVSEFMACVWGFFMQLVNNVERFKSKEEFLIAVDDHKLG